MGWKGRAVKRPFNLTLYSNTGLQELRRRQDIEDPSVSRFDPGTSETQGKFRAVPNQDTNSWRPLYCLSTGISHCSGRISAKKCGINSWMLCRFVRHPWKSRRPLCHVLCADDILTDWERKENCSWRILDLTKMFFIPHFCYIIREIRGSMGGLSTQDRLSFVVNLSRLLAQLPSYKKELTATADLAENTQKCYEMHSLFASI
jgi:hypothetical protein